jgi:ribonuclease HI
MTHSAIIYTDGGARPNPGFAGWGAHGYLYINEKSQAVKINGHQLTTTGYKLIKDVLNNEDPLTVTDYFDFFGSLLVETTNNAAEILAFIETLNRLLTVEEIIDNIIIYTDSDYVKKGIKIGLPIWNKRNWIKSDGNPVANSNHWKQLESILNIYKERNIPIDVHWVKGHNSNFGNQTADLLATIAISYSKDKILFQNFAITTAKNYWKKVIIKHPFITHRRLYFNSLFEYHKPGQYFLADPGDSKDSSIGRRMPDTAYSLIRLAEPDTIIETVLEHQAVVSKNINSILMLRIDKLYRPDIYSYLDKYKGQALTLNSSSGISLNFVDNTSITVEQNPPGLCLRAIEHSALLEELLECFLIDNGQPSSARTSIKNQTYHDITNYFYSINTADVKETANKKYLLKPEITTAIKNISVAITINISKEHILLNSNISLLFGIDIPSRNSLKKIEDLNPQIFIMTWQESDNSFRYCSIIVIKDAIGIWSNFFSNQVFF